MQISMVLHFLEQEISSGNSIFSENNFHIDERGTTLSEASMLERQYFL